MAPVAAAVIPSGEVAGPVVLLRGTLAHTLCAPPPAAAVHDRSSRSAAPQPAVEDRRRHRRLHDGAGGRCGTTSGCLAVHSFGCGVPPSWNSRAESVGLGPCAVLPVPPLPSPLSSSSSGIWTCSWSHRCATPRMTPQARGCCCTTSGSTTSRSTTNKSTSSETGPPPYPVEAAAVGVFAGVAGSAAVSAPLRMRRSRRQQQRRVGGYLLAAAAAAAGAAGSGDSGEGVDHGDGSTTDAAAAYQGAVADAAVTTAATAAAAAAAVAGASSAAAHAADAVGAAAGAAQVLHPEDIQGLSAGLQSLQEALARLVLAANDTCLAIDDVNAAIARISSSCSATSPAAAPPPASAAAELAPSPSSTFLSSPDVPLPERQPLDVPRAAGLGVSRLSSASGSLSPQGTLGSGSNGEGGDLALALQRAFVQARIDGLGKPMELALDDFVSECIQASRRGITFTDLQLRLILAEAGLPPPFGTANSFGATAAGRRSSSSSSSSREEDVEVVNPEPSPFYSEEIRVRTLWVRLVYTTLALVACMKAGEGFKEVVSPDPSTPPDPMDGFVQQTVQQAVEKEQDLAHVLLQQRGDDASTLSPSIRMMRQSQILILLTLNKAMALE